MAATRSTSRQKPAAETASDPRRNADLGMIHMAAKRMFGDVTKGGSGRDDYEAWLMQQTGQRSASALGRDQRISLVAMLRRDNLIPDRNDAITGSNRAGSADRPVSAQWAKLAACARARGWAGLDDPRLLGFVKRTARVDALRFLTRAQISRVITGLERWNGDGGAHGLS